MKYVQYVLQNSLKGHNYWNKSSTEGYVAPGKEHVSQV